MATCPEREEGVVAIGGSATKCANSFTTSQQADGSPSPFSGKSSFVMAESALKDLYIQGQEQDIMGDKFTILL